MSSGSLTETEIRTTVLMRLGNRQGNAALLAQSLLELRLVQRRLERRAYLPQFLRRPCRLTLLANTYYYDYGDTGSFYTAHPPANQPIRIAENTRLHVYEVGGIETVEALNEIEVLSLPDFQAKQYELGDAAGIPLVLTETPTNLANTGGFQVWPSPAAAYVLGFYLYYKEATLGLNDDGLTWSTNRWTQFADDLLIGELGMAMSRYVRDNDSYAVFQKESNDAWKRILDEDTARDQANNAGLRGDLRDR